MVKVPKEHSHGSRIFIAALLTGIFAFLAFLYVAPAARAQTLTINNSSGGSFPVGASWTLSLFGAPANQDITICAIDPNEVLSCTPAANLGLQAQTAAAGTWTASGVFTADAVGTWQEWVVIGAVQSNTISFSVNAYANFAIDGRTSGTYNVGAVWTLSLSSDIPNKDVWICAIVNSAPQTCTPGPALPFPAPQTTDSSGFWVDQGTFGSFDIGNWIEWAEIRDSVSARVLARSNNITFTVQNCQAEINSVFCIRLGKNCGTVSGTDNCGNSRTVADCSFGAGCSAGQACGGGGVANVCGGTSCSPLQGSVCNTNTNCGGAFTCDGFTCAGGTNCVTLGQTCGGSGVPGMCGVGTTPTPTLVFPPPPPPPPSTSQPPSGGAAPSFDSGIYDLTKHNPLSGLSFLRLFCTAANWLVTIGFILAVLMIAIAGIRMLTSQGDEAKLRLGKATLTGAIIGLLILLFAKSIILIILNFLGLPLTAMTC